MLHDRAGCCVVCGVCAPWGCLTGCQAAVLHGSVLAVRGEGLLAAQHGPPCSTGLQGPQLHVLTCGLCAADVATARYPAQAPLHARHTGATRGSFHPSVARPLQRDVCAPCSATLVAGGIRKVSHGGSDLPRVAWRVCVGAEAGAPLALVPAITPAAAPRGYGIHAQGWG